jgi:uncharacterized protein YdhG (YjbR/CyaY superfamily)
MIKFIHKFTSELDALIGYYLDMPGLGKSRDSHFPSIEKKYGKKMSHWFSVMKKISDKKYPEQIAFLRTKHNFSQVHANALVMYSKGSKSTSKFESVKDYFSSIDKAQAKTIKALYKPIMKLHKDIELTVAWNQPVLRLGNYYIFGAGVTAKYILLNPFSKSVLEKFSKKLTNLKVNKHTFAIPNDWKVDEKLMVAMAKARIAEIIK